MHLDHCMQNNAIPISKVLEAITTKKCQETFDLESLETLGDSFLKYAVSQQFLRPIKINPRVSLLRREKNNFKCSTLQVWMLPRKLLRLEFLGDSVLDYLMTKHFYLEYPGLSPEQLTDMRSASVNNECYARSAVKFRLHEHILRDSQELDKQIVETCNNFEKLSSKSTFGWDAVTTFTEVLGDIIESLAGAILVDSGYNTEIVFDGIRPLLEPLITPEMPMSHPIKELTELCHKEHYIMTKTNKNRNDDEGLSYITIKVDANGLPFERTDRAANGKTARKLACKKLLKSLKDHTLNGKK